MKPLASADLDSHLQLAQQFLNMGKPYSFEGIGILTRVKPGEFEFTPIAISTEKIKEQQKTETAETPAGEEQAGSYESFLALPKPGFEWRRPVLGLFALCGIAIAVWGGYVISKKNGKKTMTAAQQAVDIQSAANVIAPDTTTATEPAQPSAPEHYKYILETAKKKRAIKRYNQLKDIRWKVQLETSDSVEFKLFMLLPAHVDTTRSIDSLTALTGRKVRIEYPQ